MIAYQNTCRLATEEMALELMPCTQFRRTLSSRTTPDNLIAVGSPPRRQPLSGEFFRRPATLSGEFFRRPLFREPTTYSEPPEADLHASGNPTGQPEFHAPPRADLPCRTVTHAPARDGAWLTFRPRPTHLQARLAASWPSSPPAAPPSPASPPFVLFLAFLPFRPHLTGLPLHLRGLGYCFSSSPGTSRPFFSVDCTSHSRGLTVCLSPPEICTRLRALFDPNTENYLSWSASVELWFMGQGYEDHLAKGLYTNDIQRLYKVASAIVHLSQQDLDLSTYIGQIASLKEQFLTVMPLTPDVGAQQTQLDKFFMVLTLIGLRPDLEPIRDQILGSSSVPSLDDVFARLLRLSSTQTLPSASASDSSVLVSHTTSRGGRSGTRGRGQRPHCTYCNKLGHTRDRCYQLHGRPPRTAHMAQSSDFPLPQPPSSSASQTFSGFYCLYCPAWYWLGMATGRDRSTGKTIGIGRESQGLYHLTSDSSPAVCISTDAPLLIHNRLGHPSLSKFQKMVPRFSTLSSLPCESCQLGKHTRVSFPKRLNNRAKSPLSLSTLMFGVLVGLPQFTSFMSHHGILHQSSCAHTPQQNGVAERKNRHLVETARTLLLHSHVPFRFWGDAILTACYLINRMPSSVLHDQIPHSLLFPDQPLYFLPPRVFGCTCFVHILTPGQDKLSAKAMKCLFLGYSRLQKVLPIPIVSPPEAMPPRPLQVYHRRPRVVAPLPFPEAPADSLPIPSTSPAPALPSPHDLPIAVRERAPMKLFPIQAGDRQWWMKWLLCTLMALGILLFYPLVNLQLVVVGSMQLRLVPDGQVDRLKARLVAKGYTQVYGSDYGDTFSPVAKIASVRLLLSMAAMCSWPLYQLDIKNVFLHGDLVEEVYMEQPPGFVAQGESGLVCSTADHSVFIIITPWGSCIYLVVYVDDIVITGSDQDAQSSSGVVLSQRKYALDILEETGEPLGDPGRYRRLVGKLNYLTITRPDISFLTPGQGVLYENRGHTQVVGYTDADWAGSPTDRRSTSGYCVFIGGNLISWKSKKQDVVARSSAEAEYRAMALATCELIWLRHLLQELRFGKDEQMKLICDNQAALHIASNPVFHERTKHIEVDCHFIREKIASGCVATSFVNSNDQLADIFTKSLRGPRIKYICNKLGAYDVYAPA
ncbi:Retrovirus-related Pol polyprotein from transposon TNT 1-94 [Vitis vinifera]|uniref:Retrovirus-related Pol polyprotein from transposon TNT 1-94 n=1 Tax=Vitis vinifera TaxID=29760 RepID=A0A438IYI8_VITVI|nr:Retrovirus-related Pol polyprotein from transposon TNT 1-94 [Vitis vinifera]